ncbi:MAG: SRPBCC family protein, partial [Planctomycetaceae bacterium]
MRSLRSAFAETLRLWFGFARPVSRPAYLLTGVGLMAVKYGVEAGVLRMTTGRTLMPWTFLSPLYTGRIELLETAPDWVGPAFYVWTLPFLWIALSMSVRRAANALVPPWLGLGVLVPFVNYLVMLGLAMSPAVEPLPAEPPRSPSRHPAALDLLAVFFGPAYTLLMVGTVVYALNDYGAVLFFLTPVLIGAVSAYLSAIGRPDDRGRPFVIALVSLAASGLTLLLLAFEGIICLAMAAPLALAGGMLGAGVGLLIAQLAGSPWPRSDLFGCLLVLPLLAVVEAEVGRPPLRSVTTETIVNAPPEVVWRQVVRFPDLDERPEWYFRAGIACPTGAQIDGRGVGAVRRCQFTTGEFVEPITAWDEPRRLAFDVASQPHPMAEVNPFGDPHPPHLDTALVSERGEFRLEPLPGDRTRLVGTTWYRLRMAPQEYWSVWTDAIIHRIHKRVLRHVGRLAEANEPMPSEPRPSG